MGAIYCSGSMSLSSRHLASLNELRGLAGVGLGRTVGGGLAGGDTGIAAKGNRHFGFGGGGGGDLCMKGADPESRSPTDEALRVLWGDDVGGFWGGLGDDLGVDFGKGFGEGGGEGLGESFGGGGEEGLGEFLR